jgi:biotin carboxyl carrier protein
VSVRTFKFTIAGKPYKVEVEDTTGSVLVVKVNGKRYTVCRDGREMGPPAEIAGALVDVPVTGAEPEATTAYEEVRAPMPGKILVVAVHPGNRVRYRDALCTLEVMKMEAVIHAPLNGRVREVRVRPGDSVEYDDVLVVITRLGD